MPGEQTDTAVDLDALSAITQAVGDGAGLPEVVRAAARALDASIVLIDRSSAVLAVAARSSADERALMTDAAGVQAHELRVGDSVVGRLRLRGRGGDPSPGMLRIVSTLIASEVEVKTGKQSALHPIGGAYWVLSAGHILLQVSLLFFPKIILG